MATATEMSASKDSGVPSNEPRTELPSTLSDDETSQTSAPSTDSEAFNPGWRFKAAFLSLCVIVLMSALDATSLSVALPVRILSIHAHHFAPC